MREVKEKLPCLYREDNRRPIEYFSREVAVRHLSNILEEVEDFRAVCNYIKEFIEHYNAMKEHHLEAEVYQCMNAGDSFFDACREWDI